MTSIRWGVMGTSRHAATTLIPAIKAARNSEVIAVASRHADRAREYAAANQIAASYGDYESLLNAPDIDAVYIPLPNDQHKPWAIRAAQAGKHVLCEKPLGLNAAEAEEMVQAFKDAGLTLAEAFQWRHHPQGQHVREMLRDGAIGDLRLINAGFSFMLTRENDIRWNPDQGGGALYDVGCYPVSLTRYIAGQEPVAVTAQARWNASGADDMLVATLEFPGGVMATLHCSFVLPLRRFYEVMGSTGTLAVNYAYNPKDDRPGEVILYGDDWQVNEVFPLATANSYTLMVEDFADAIQHNRPPLFPAEDAIGNMRVLDALYEAARSGQRVIVNR